MQLISECLFRLDVCQQSDVGLAGQSHAALQANLAPSVWESRVANANILN